MHRGYNIHIDELFRTVIIYRSITKYNINSGILFPSEHRRVKAVGV
jgi:hypothetical protein